MLSKQLRKLRREKDLTQKELALKLHVSDAAVAMWESGKRTPDIETLKKIASILGTSIDALTGHTDDSFVPPAINVRPIRTHKIPLLGEIACGEPIFAEENKETFISADSNIKADFCLIAKGESMINADIKDGDVVFIKTQPIVNDGEIAAVIIEDEATLKRVYYDKENNTLVLQAENPRYKPMIFKNEELEKIRILGKIVALYREF